MHLTEMVAFARICLITVLLAGVLLPRASGALISVLPGFHSAVICTGGELVRITFGPNGAPVEVIREHDCTLVEPSATPALSRSWRRLALAPGPASPSLSQWARSPVPYRGLSPSRAPPRSI
ncbi:MAG: hypothetical protein AAGI50_03420 [Pseudomonadota bacterium]